MLNKQPIKMHIVEIGTDIGYNNQELHNVFYSINQSQEDEDLLCEDFPLSEFDNHFNPGRQEFSISTVIQESVSFNNFSHLKKGLKNLASKMEESLTGSKITLSGYSDPAELKPRKNKLFAYVAVQFDFSDGQAIKILFHSPGGDSRTFDKDDLLVSYAQSLNGRDITHLFSEKEGLTTPKFAKRLIQLLIKNSEKFQKRKAELAEKKELIAKKEKENEELANDIEEFNEEAAKLEFQIEQGTQVVKNLEEEVSEKQKRKKELKKVIKELKKKVPSKETEDLKNSGILGAQKIANDILAGTHDEDPDKIEQLLDQIVEILPEEDELLNKAIEHMSDLLMKVA